MEDESVEQQVQDDIEETNKRARGHGTSSRAQERKRARLGTDADRAIKSRNARRYAELLRLAGVAEDSPAWKRAWDIFYGKGAS